MQQLRLTEVDNLSTSSWLVTSELRFSPREMPRCCAFPLHGKEHGVPPTWQYSVSSFKKLHYKGPSASKGSASTDSTNSALKILGKNFQKVPKSKLKFTTVVVHQSHLTLCNPMDCSMPGFPVLNHLLELAQTQIHWVGGAIQPSHPQSSPSPPANYLHNTNGNPLQYSCLENPMDWGAW